MSYSYCYEVQPCSRNCVSCKSLQLANLVGVEFLYLAKLNGLRGQVNIGAVEGKEQQHVAGQDGCGSPATALAQLPCYPAPPPFCLRTWECVAGSPLQPCMAASGEEATGQRGGESHAFPQAFYYPLLHKDETLGGEILTCAMSAMPPGIQGDAENQL